MTPLDTDRPSLLPWQRRLSERTPCSQAPTPPSPCSSSHTLPTSTASASRDLRPRPSTTCCPATPCACSSSRLASDKEAVAPPAGELHLSKALKRARV